MLSDITNFPNGITSFGIPVLGGGVPTMFGDYWFADYANGLDGRTGKSIDLPFKTFSRAEDRAATNKNDVILLNGGSSHSQLSEMLAFDKNRIHVFGLGTFGAVDMQPEIQLSSAANSESNAATMKVSGYGNTFTNLYISNAGDHSDSVTALWDAGENNVYTNCQFAKLGDLGETAVSDVEARGDSTTWRTCKFGVDWVLQTVARPTLWIKGTGASARMKHNYFEYCYFICATSEADKAFILIYDTNSLGFGNVMREPIFMAAIVGSIGAVKTDNVIDSVADLAEGNLLIIRPAFNSTTLATTLKAGIQVIGPTSAAAAGQPQNPA